MSIRSIGGIFWLGCAAVVVFGAGCGNDAPTVSEIRSSVIPPLQVEKADDAPTGLATEAPGLIEMPKNFDPASLPQESKPATVPGESGFEMPNEDGSRTVVAQRPVIDDVADANSKHHVKLTFATLSEVEQSVAKAGKICVVDFWSLACEPCLKEFPGLVQLQEEFGDQIVCFSVSVDYDGRKSKPAESYRPRVEAFLQTCKPTFENFLCGTPNEEVYQSLKIPSIPAVLIYDAQGKMIRKFVDSGEDAGFGYAEDVQPFVKSLVTP